MKIKECSSIQLRKKLKRLIEKGMGNNRWAKYIKYHLKFQCISPEEIKNLKLVKKIGPTYLSLDFFEKDE